jgi:fluoride exporter
MTLIVLGLGGAIGAIARHVVTGLVHRHLTSAGWAGIFVVNAAGCFAIGLLAGLLAHARMEMSEASRTFVIVGLLGGFTTFSSYTLDTFTLLRGGHMGVAVFNAAGQVIAGLAALAVGYAAASSRG